MASRKTREQEPVEHLDGQLSTEDMPPVTDPAAQQIEPAYDIPERPTGQDVDAVQSLLDWLVDKASKTDQDEWAQMAASVGRILAGGSAEEVLSQDLPISGKSFVDRPFWLHGFTVTETDFPEGPIPFYANMDVSVAGGERRVVNCGGAKVLAKLKVLDDEGDYPYMVMLTGKKTKAGNTVLDLVRPV